MMQTIDTNWFYLGSHQGGEEGELLSKVNLVEHSHFNALLKVNHLY